MRKIAIIGAGGFGREVKMLIDQINHIEKKYEFIGFYDDNIPIDSEVNGFKIDVETESTTNPLKRRRAIAINKQNIIMLKGEWSFSSIDQILIDELVFYIQQNNLKAD
jgi:hypothetical protein